MDAIHNQHRETRRKAWNVTKAIIVLILLIVCPVKCAEESSGDTSRLCNNCSSSNNKLRELHKDGLNGNERYEQEGETFLDDILTTIELVSEKMIAKSNKSEKEMEEELIKRVDESLKTDYYEITDGISIESLKNFNRSDIESTDNERAIFSPFSFERKLVYRIRNFLETHVLSISFPKAARLFGIRSFGLKKFLVPVLIGAQVLKGVLFAMFLPSILGSFGKIVGKGLSHLSASSSQASYPPVQDEPDPYAEDQNKDVAGYETDPQGAYAYPQDPSMNIFHAANDVNGLADVTMSRYGPGGAKVTYLPTKNNEYYKNQVSSNNYKVFHKIPASSMILSNYDPFYSPLLSRLDGIFARLGLAPRDSDPDPSSLSSVKLEACREQLICLMYASPAKYAPYSNLVSAQLSRELNELRRPTSDNAEILRFFRYMRAARRGQEGADCMRSHPGCSNTPAEPEHTMIAAYHDINKLVTARKIAK